MHLSLLLGVPQLVVAWRAQHIFGMSLLFSVKFVRDEFMAMGNSRYSGGEGGLCCDVNLL